MGLNKPKNHAIVPLSDAFAPPTERTRKEEKAF
jgi:hypothetical protein